MENDTGQRPAPSGQHSQRRARTRSRIGWLESIVREYAPGIDLDGGQSHHNYHQGHQVNRARAFDPPHSPESAATATRRNHTKDNASLRDVTDQIGLVSVNGADLRYLGPASGLFFTRLVLIGLERKVQMENISFPESNDGLTVPPELLDARPRRAAARPETCSVVVAGVFPERAPATPLPS